MLKTLANFSQSIQKARFLSVSLAIHVVLGMTLGTIVLFKAAPQEAFITTVGDGFLDSDENTSQVDPLSEPTEFEEPSVSASNVSPLMEASAIQSIAANTNFQMTYAMSDVQTMGSVVSGSMATGSQSTALSTGGGRQAMASGGFFGVADPSKTGLIGSFYDLKQTQNGQPTEVGNKEYDQVVLDFIDTWNASKLRKFYKAPTTLVSPFIFTPNISAHLAPKAFGVDKTVKPSRWIAWYRARVSPPKTGVYHFVGGGDDVMLVKFNGKLVLSRCWYLKTEEAEPEANYRYGFSDIKDGFAKGRSFRAEQGKFYDLDILIGEQPGGLFFASLLIEQQGQKYEKDKNGNPILPIFRVSPEMPLTEGNPKYPPYMKEGPIWLAQPAKN